MMSWHLRPVRTCAALCGLVRPYAHPHTRSSLLAQALYARPCEANQFWSVSRACPLLEDRLNDPWYTNTFEIGGRVLRAGILEHLGSCLRLHRRGWGALKHCLLEGSRDDEVRREDQTEAT